MSILVNNLRSIDDNVFNETWEKFLFNPEQVLALLKDAPAEEVTEVLAAGTRWTGTGWNTTKAAKAVRGLTGIALVSAKFSDYLWSFLYSLSLHAGVELQCVDLSDKASDVAFVLADLWASWLGEKEAGSPAGVPAAVAARNPAGEDASDEEEEEEEVQRLPWEAPLETLPSELQVCLRRLKAGERLQCKLMLEGVPTYEGLKQRSEDNNHGQDARNMGDKFLKTIQQRCLNMARVQAALFGQVEGQYAVLAQQLFYYTVETEGVILRERKRRSLPGSVQDTEHALFTAEDLRKDQQVAKINSAGMIYRKNMSHFPNPAGHKSFKYKGKWNAVGKGKGSWPNYGSFGWSGSGFKPWQRPAGGKGKGRGKAWNSSPLNLRSPFSFFRRLQGPLWQPTVKARTWQSKVQGLKCQAWQPNDISQSFGTSKVAEYNPGQGSFLGIHPSVGTSVEQHALVAGKRPSSHCQTVANRYPGRCQVARKVVCQTPPQSLQRRFCRHKKF